MAKAKPLKCGKRWLLSSLILLALLVIITFNPISIRLMTVGVAVYYDIDPFVFYRLIRTESAFRAFAVSPKQAVGLGQMLENTARYIQPEYRSGMLFVPLYNLKLCAKYIRYLQGKYRSNWTLVLAAYNWGETNVDRRIRGMQVETDADYRHLFRDIRETRAYIDKILQPEEKP